MARRKKQLDPTVSIRIDREIDRAVAAWAHERSYSKASALRILLTAALKKRRVPILGMVDGNKSTLRRAGFQGDSVNA